MTRTKATKISNTIIFKHQYISSPTISPKSHMVAPAQQLVMALQGNIPAGNEIAKALTRVSKLFTKIASAKKEVAKAREQRNRLRTNPLAWNTTHLPRVALPPPRGDVPVPRVAEAPQADCRVAQTVANTSMMQPVVQAPTTRSFSWSPRVNAQPPAAQPNYILQDKEDNNTPPKQQTTRSAAQSIMQEAMLTCVDIYRPEYTISKDLGLLNYTLNPIKPMAKFMVSLQQMSIRRL